MNNNYYDIREKNNSYNNLLSPKEGFIKGNIFDNLYNQYKNYKINSPRITNKKQELLYNILKYKFALIELDLYLDIYPNDTSIIELYNQYLTEEKKLCNDYENIYTSLSLDSNYLDKTPWEWLNSPWPWEEVN